MFTVQIETLKPENVEQKFSSSFEIIGHLWTMCVNVFSFLHFTREYLFF